MPAGSPFSALPESRCVPGDRPRPPRPAGLHAHTTGVARGIRNPAAGRAVSAGAASADPVIDCSARLLRRSSGPGRGCAGTLSRSASSASTSPLRRAPPAALRRRWPEDARYRLRKGRRRVARVLAESAGIVVRDVVVAGQAHAYNGAGFVPMSRRYTERRTSVTEGVGHRERRAGEAVTGDREVTARDRDREPVAEVGAHSKRHQRITGGAEPAEPEPSVEIKNVLWPRRKKEAQTAAFDLLDALLRLTLPGALRIELVGWQEPPPSTAGCPNDTVARGGAEGPDRRGRVAVAVHDGIARAGGRWRKHLCTRRRYVTLGHGGRSAPRTPSQQRRLPRHDPLVDRPATHPRSASTTRPSRRPGPGSASATSSSPIRASGPRSFPVDDVSPSLTGSPTIL